MPEALRADFDGKALVCGAIYATGRAPILTLCRRLVARGYDPAAALHCYRVDRLAVTVRQIGDAAALSLREDEKGARWVRHNPLDKPPRQGAGFASISASREEAATHAAPGRFQPASEAA